MLRKFYPVFILMLLMAACTPSSTPVQAPTDTAVSLLPSATPVSPTETETAVSVSPAASRVSPTATASPVPSTETPAPAEMAADSVTPTMAIRNFPSVNCCTGRTVQVGLYRLPDWLDMPLSVEVGEGWRVMNEEQAKLFTLARGQNSLNNPSEWIVFMNASSAGSAEGLLAQFLEEPSVVPLGEPTVVDLAGYAGWQQDFAVLPNPDYPGNASSDIPAGVQYIHVVEQFFAPGFSWTSSSPEAQLRLVVVNVGDALLFIYLEAPPDQFATFAADADQMLQTLELLEP